MTRTSRKILCLLFVLLTALSSASPALAAEVRYMPDVTPEMSDASYWSALRKDASDVILTPEEIRAFNQDTIDASGTMVMDLKNAAERYDGIARNEAVRNSSKADAEYYFGWTYDPATKEIAEWDYYQKMIDNCIDPNAVKDMPVRYAIAVRRTVLQVFPSDDPIWDDPADTDFSYQALSAIRVNEPILIYNTSADGKYYLARISSCSGWVAAEDVALCANKEEWLSAWDIPADKLLVVYGNKEYTDASNTAPEVSRRMLTQGTTLELVTGLAPDQLVNNRYPYHNYVVYLPVRRSDGSYEKQMAMLPETARVSVGYLPLTQENIAMVALNNLGDAYGWGGMLDVEDCSGMVRTVYQCFGLDIARNGNWQWNMNIEKLDMKYMSLEEKQLILDGLPIGAALCFPGHEMMYLGKVDGKYYVVSTVSSIMSPDTGNRLRTRDVMINTLDVKRANGQTWLEALNMAFMPCYAKLEGKTYDFPMLQWYRDGVAHCLKNGLLPLKEDGSFGIGQTVTRAELANALWITAGRPETGTERVYMDIPEEHTARAAIVWAAETGVLPEKTSEAFAPEETVTREVVIGAIWRLEQIQELPVSAVPGEMGDYKDMDAVSEDSLPAFRWACGLGITVGTGNGQLSPDREVSREQLGMLLCRYSQLPREETAGQEDAADSLSEQP